MSTFLPQGSTNNSLYSTRTLSVTPTLVSLNATNTIFSYFGTPPISGIGQNAYTLYIEGAPTPSMTGASLTGGSYALYVNSGLSSINSLIVANKLQIPTGAGNGYLLQSDASGNASWANITTGFTGFANGTVTNPGAYFTSETNTGLYRIAAGNIGITTAGTLRVDINASRLLMSTPIYLQNGTSGSPSLAFHNSTNSGIFYNGTDVNLTNGGNTQLSLTPSGFISNTQPILILNKNTNQIMDRNEHQAVSWGSSYNILRQQGITALNSGSPTATMQFQVNVAGYYVIHWEYGFEWSATSPTFIQAFVTNGNIVSSNNRHGYQELTPVATSTYYRGSSSCVLFLNANETVEFYNYVEGTGTFTFISSDQNTCNFSIYKLF